MLVDRELPLELKSRRQALGLGNQVQFIRSVFPAGRVALFDQLQSQRRDGDAIVPLGERGIVRLTPLNADPHLASRFEIENIVAATACRKEIQLPRPAAGSDAHVGRGEFHDAVAIFVQEQAGPRLPAGVAGRLEPERRRGGIRRVRCREYDPLRRVSQLSRNWLIVLAPSNAKPVFQ